jgi:transmembrane sensor
MDTKQNKYLNLLAKVLAKKASSKEKQLLELWAKEGKENQAFVDETTKIWELSGNYAKETPIDTNAAFAKFEAKIATAIVKEPSSGITRKLFKNWHVAASVLLFLSISIWWVSSNNDNVPVMVQVETGEEEQKEVELPDGSVVVLNENSKIFYNHDFESRVVQLEGEAFFNVTKQDGAKFEINTSATKTTVLGTSFNVKAYEDDQEIEVTVLNGKVAFEELKKENTVVLLLANESAIFDKNSERLNKLSSSNINSIAWKTQKLVFDNTELSEVMETLERFFGVEIENKNGAMLNCRFTGSYDKPKLEDIFAAVVFSMSLEVEKVDQKYILIGQGCDNIGY